MRLSRGILCPNPPGSLVISVIRGEGPLRERRVVLRLAGFLRRVGEEKSRHLVLVGAVDVNGDMTTRALDGHISSANRPQQHAEILMCMGQGGGLAILLGEGPGLSTC